MGKWLAFLKFGFLGCDDLDVPADLFQGLLSSCLGVMHPPFLQQADPVRLWGMSS